MRRLRAGRKLSRLLVWIMAAAVLCGLCPHLSGASMAQSVTRRDTAASMVDESFAAIQDNQGLILRQWKSRAGTTQGDWFAFGYGRSGRTQECQEYLEALEQYVTGCYQAHGYGLSRNKPTEWHRILLTVLACGGDPLAFGRDASGQPVNLLAEGVYNCRIGAPWKQGVNGAAFALLSLDSRKYTVPAGASYDREDILNYLIGKERPEGGFALGGSALDVDVTAMALQAMAPYEKTDRRVAQVIARGLDALGAAQQPQGDFRENISSADSAESTAQVLVTLCTLGIDPLQDSRFISSQGKTVLDGLERYYLTGGGFRHQLSENTADVLATQQGIYALTAYIRFCDGKGSLYDFSDMSTGTETASPEESSLPSPAASDKPTGSETPGQTSAPKKTKAPRARKTAGAVSTPAGQKTGKRQGQRTNGRRSGSNTRPLGKTGSNAETSGKTGKKVTSGDLILHRHHGYVRAKTLDRVAGSSHRIRICVRHGDIRYSMTFRGGDLVPKSGQAFDIVWNSRHRKQIQKMAAQAEIFEVRGYAGIDSLTAQGMVHMGTGLADGDYLLMEYIDGKDPVYCQKITVKDSMTRFLLDHTGTYFIARRIKLAGQNAQESVAEAQETTTPGVAAASENKNIRGANGSSAWHSVIRYLAGIVAAVLAAGTVLMGCAHRSRRKADKGGEDS